MPWRRTATNKPDGGSYSSIPQLQGNAQKPLISHTHRISRLNAFARHFKEIATKALTTLKRKVRGAPSEEPKVLASRSRSKATIVCLVHSLPILGSIVIAALNLKGFFIGGQLSGDTDPSIQAIYILCLQVTAKLFELFSVASLGLIVLDTIRYFLFFDDHGLPLGLAGTKMKFTDLTFLITPTFWSAVRGFKSWRRRVFVALLIIICCLLSTFIGPASALLLIPVIRTDWPAGGTQFWLTGTQESLWPDTLNLSSVGGDHCLSPSAETIFMSSLNNSGCVWYWTPGLSEYAKDIHFQDTTNNITVYDGITEREMQRRSSGDTWVLSNMAHISRMSWALSLRWLDAVLYATRHWSKLSSYSRFYFRDRTGSVARVHSLIPAVRSSCGTYVEADFNSSMAFAYPILPPYTSGSQVTNSYGIDPQLYHKTSTITTRWLQKPTGPNLTFNHTQIDYYPSAFLTVQLPYADSSTRGTVFTCSIDARWAEGNNVGTNVRSVTDGFLQHGEVDSNAAMFAWTDMLLPMDDGTWRTVDLDVEWLANLTPDLPAWMGATTPPKNNTSTPGWTTLSYILQQAGYSNVTGDVNDPADLYKFTEEVVALLVADGMSRVGFTENSGTISQTGALDDTYFPWIENWDSMVLALVTNGAAITAPSSSQNGAATFTGLDWTVTITGYSYLADSTAYYLALTVVFLYMAFALIHIVYTLRKRCFSDVWNEVPDIVALCQNSPSSVLLTNTSAGIKAHATSRLTLKLRVPDIDKEVQEKVSVIVGLDGPEVGYGRVELGKKYA